MKPIPSPTPEQLAHFAATLAKGSTVDAADLSRQALQIWIASHRLIESATQPTEPPAPLPYALPKQWPCFLDEFLLLVVKRRAADRMHLWREFMRDLLGAETGKKGELLDREFDKAIQIRRGVGYDAFTFNTEAEAFVEWEKGIPSRKARKAAEAKNLKKTLGTTAKDEKQHQAPLTPVPSKAPARRTAKKRGKK